MSLYLVLNAGIIILPLLLSFEKKITFYKKLPHVLASIIFVGAFFVSWDILAAAEGHWDFNKQYTGKMELFGLPLEEILFFITVPYAMLFLYESFSFYFRSRFRGKLDFRKAVYILVPLLITAGFLFLDQGYTSIVLFFSAVILLILSVFYNHVNFSLFWIFILISYIPFFIVNFILTSAPVVLYNPEHIWGFRIFTIPAEDFIYSFSLISFYLLVYSVSADFKHSIKRSHDKGR